MGIDMLAGFQRVQPYYRASDIPTVNEDAVKSQNLSQQPVEDVASPALASRRPEANAKLEDISLTFHKEDQFDYLGSESDLGKLDMEKAISDMKKDSILQDYQYFVGSSVPGLTTEDGLVFQK